VQFGESPAPRDVALAAVSSVAASVRGFARAAAAHPDAPVAFAAGVVPNVRAVRLVLVVPVAVVIVVLVGRRVPDVVARVAAGQPDVPAPALLPSGVGALAPAAVRRCAARAAAVRRYGVAAVRRCAAREAVRRCGVAEVRRCAAQDVAVRRCGVAEVRRYEVAEVRRCAAVLVSREVLRDAEQVLRALAGLVFSLLVKARYTASKTATKSDATNPLIRTMSLLSAGFGKQREAGMKVSNPRGVTESKSRDHRKRGGQHTYPPPDFELSVADARQKWGSSFQSATLLPRKSLTICWAIISNKAD
jgi:hypothetical protein